jgi:hypothetical protein
MFAIKRWHERRVSDEKWIPTPVIDSKDGERGRNRTSNLLIKSQLLCQLSYAPEPCVFIDCWESTGLAFRNFEHSFDDDPVQLRAAASRLVTSSALTIR